MRAHYSFDEEPQDLHGECKAELDSLRAQLAEAQKVIEAARIISRDHWVDDEMTLDEHPDALALAEALAAYDAAMSEREDV